MHKRMASFGRVVVLALVVSCGGGSKSDSPRSVPDALPLDGPTVCRTPSSDYGPTSHFDLLPNGTSQAAQTCPVACGESAWPSSGAPTIDVALPYGACAAGTSDCEALGQMPCACGSNGGPTHEFKCSCEGGTWICRIRFMGTALCTPCSDAGPAVSNIGAAGQACTSGGGCDPGLTCRTSDRICVSSQDAALPTGNCSSLPLGGIGIPAGTVATASASYAPSCTPDLAIDGVMDTGWNSGVFSGWLTLQFPKPTAITAVHIVAGSNPTTNETYTITSDSQATIGAGTRQVVSGPATGSMLDPITVTPGTYSSITITINGGASWVAILELSLINDECPLEFPHCVGTLKSTTCPVNVFTCPPGCRLMIGSGGYCTGAPHACSTNTTADACTMQRGCAWSDATPACTGTPASCSGQYYDACLAAGCQHVGDDPSCSGTLTPCSQLSVADCALQWGCTLSTAVQ